ncbi:MAG: hypothetical protein WCI27_09540, partial [Candidatus Omnitrophota bacterium]
MLIIAFLAIDIAPASAQAVMPTTETRIGLTPAFNPMILKGMKVYAKEPFRFDFILDKGDKKSEAETLRATSVQDDALRLVKYFLAALTIPEKDLWVNLSPYEKDRIVPEAFGQTEMGRDLLAQDYILKQITASLMYPEEGVGKKFWSEIYRQAQAKFGTTDIPIDTFNKVWIMPAKAVVYEKPRAVGAAHPQEAVAYVVESRLKAMLESDYKAHAIGASKDEALPRLSKTQDMTKSLIRDIILPVLEKEINEGQNFAQLRQVYNSLILAVWYKKKLISSLRQSPLGFYLDQNKVTGVNIDDPKESEKIWSQYVESFKKGAYNYIRDEYDSATQEMIPRKYFAGGVVLPVDLSMVSKMDASQIVPFESYLTLHIEAQGVGYKKIYPQNVISEESTINQDANGMGSDAFMVEIPSFNRNDPEQRKVVARQLLGMMWGGKPVFTPAASLYMAGKGLLNKRLAFMKGLLELQRDGRSLFEAQLLFQILQFYAAKSDEFFRATIESLAAEKVNGEWLLNGSQIIEFIRWGFYKKRGILDFLRQHAGNGLKVAKLFSFFRWIRKGAKKGAEYWEGQKNIVKGIPMMDVGIAHQLCAMLNSSKEFDDYVDRRVAEDERILRQWENGGISGVSEDDFQHLFYSLSQNIRQRTAAQLEKEFLTIFKKQGSAKDLIGTKKVLLSVLGKDDALKSFLFFRDYLCQKVDADGQPLFNVNKIGVLLSLTQEFVRSSIDFWMSQKDEGRLIVTGGDIFWSIQRGWSKERGELFTTLWQKLKSKGLPVRRLINTIVLAEDLHSTLEKYKDIVSGELPLEVLKLKAALVSGVMADANSGVEKGLQMDVEDVIFLFQSVGILSDNVVKYIDASLVEDNTLIKEVERGKVVEDYVLRRLFLSFSLDIRQRMAQWLLHQPIPGYVHIDMEVDGIQSRFDQYCRDYRWARSNAGMYNFWVNWEITAVYFRKKAMSLNKRLGQSERVLVDVLPASPITPLRVGGEFRAGSGMKIPCQINMMGQTWS